VRYAYPHVESKFLDIKKRLLKFGAYSATVVTTYRAWCTISQWLEWLSPLPLFSNGVCASQ